MGNRLRNDDGTGSELTSSWARGWKFLAGTVLVVLIGVAAFAVVAVATTAKKPTVHLAQADVSRASSPDRSERGAVVHVGSLSLGLHHSGLGAQRPAPATTTSTTVAPGSPSTSVAGRAGTPGAIVRPGLAIGTVAIVNGSSFTVTVAGSPVPKIVTTSANTQLTMTGPGTVADASPGTVVIVSGARQFGGVLAARQVTILPAVQHRAGAAAASLPSSLPTALGDLTGLKALPGLADLPLVVGTVTANHGATLTLSTLFGPVTVTTSPSTAVTVTKTVGLSAVTVGAKVQVVGTVGVDGSLAAKVVHLGSLPLPLAR